MNPEIENFDIDTDEEEAQREAQIKIVVVAPGVPAQIVTIDNDLPALQGVVSGLIEVFPVGIEGAIGVCNEEGLLLGLPPCRYVNELRRTITGTFFIAGDGVNFHSLNQPQIDTALRLF